MALTFDEAELLDRVDNDRDFLAETVQMLVSDAPVLLAKIRAALAAGDAAEVGRSAHALKGMVSNFCASETQARALEVEAMGKSGVLTSAAAATDVLEKHVGALIEELLRFSGAKA